MLSVIASEHEVLRDEVERSCHVGPSGWAAGRSNAFGDVLVGMMQNRWVHAELRFDGRVRVEMNEGRHTDLPISGLL